MNKFKEIKKIMSINKKVFLNIFSIQDNYIYNYKKKINFSSLIFLFTYYKLRINKKFYLIDLNSYRI